MENLQTTTTTPEAEYPSHTIIEVITRENREGSRKAILVTGAIEDVAAYFGKPNQDVMEILRFGTKMFEREAREFGFTIPAGYHYRR